MKQNLKTYILPALCLLALPLLAIRLPGDSGTPAPVTTGDRETATIATTAAESSAAAPEDTTAVPVCTIAKPVFTPLDVPLGEDLQRQIHDLCLSAGVPFPVVMGIIWHESKFDPQAVSHTDDHGLMQINGGNFKWLRKELGSIDYYDPLQNVRAGLHILSPLWHKYPPHKALMAYGYGEAGAAAKWGKGQVTCQFSREMLAQAGAYGWDPDDEKIGR